MAKVLVLGGGFGGVVAAERLAQLLSDEHQITVVSRSRNFIFYPALVKLAFGKCEKEDVSFDLRHTMLSRRVNFVEAEVAHIDPFERKVTIAHGEVEGKLPYDYLIFALGRRLATEKITGFYEHAHHLLNVDKAIQFGKAVEEFNEGRVVLGQCFGARLPVPVYESAFALARLLKAKGKRERTTITVVSPDNLESEIGDAIAAVALKKALDDHRIELLTNHRIQSLTQTSAKTSSGNTVDFNLLMLIPPFQGPPAARYMGVTDDEGYIKVDWNMRVRGHERMYAVGDCVSFVGPKMGHMAVRQGEVVAANLAAEIEGHEPISHYFHEMRFVIEGVGSESFYMHKDIWTDEPAIIRQGRFWSWAKHVQQEARNPFFRVVELTDDTVDPSVWGKNFPLQYDDYLKTTDQVRTRYGGSEAEPRTPTQAHPRSIVAQSRLEEDLRLKIMWAGYAFSKDFREERGHAYMLDDQMFTERQQVTKQPGTCINCHASAYVAYKQLGGGDIFKGFEALNKMPYFDARKYVTHPVACIDCHDSQTMQLRITRPAFIKGMRALKASQGIQNYDVNKQATRQEMRAYVCGQCHDEYHFSGPEKRLVYPWAKGLLIENILAFYDEEKFKDWERADIGAPVLKAQHPEFEMWNQGIHARSGVVCADCHMPYKREGALKISDYHVRSPLLNINRACQTCHKWSEDELKARVETIQSRTFNLRNLAMDALVELINDIKAARGAGRNDVGVTAAQDFQRRAQFYVDFIESENSTGFHASQEAARILGESINFSRKGQVALRSSIQSTSEQGK